MFAFVPNEHVDKQLQYALRHDNLKAWTAVRLVNFEDERVYDAGWFLFSIFTQPFQLEKM